MKRKQTAALLNRTLAAGDYAAVLAVLATFVDAADNVTDLAREVGVHRTHLYRMFNPGTSPSFEAVLKLLTALGLRLRAS